MWITKPIFQTDERKILGNVRLHKMV